MPQIQGIPVNKIGIDMTYQRPLSSRHVAKIAREFDPDRVGHLVVSARDDGTYWVVDGQHRLTAMKNIGYDDPVQCIVHEGLTVDKEAKLFAAQADTKRIHPIYVYQAKLEAGDPKFTALDELIRNAGFEVTFSRKGDDVLQSPMTLMEIYERHGATHTSYLLDVLAESWTGRDAVAPNYMVTGLNSFILRYYHDFERDRLIETLRRVPTGDLTNMAIMFAKGLHESKAQSYGRAIAQAYNRKLKGDNRLPAWDADSKTPDDDDVAEGPL